MGSEPSKYQQEKKSKRDYQSSGERNGNSLNSLNVRGKPLFEEGYKLHRSEFAVWGVVVRKGNYSRMLWEGQPENVKVMYAK